MVGGGGGGEVVFWVMVLWKLTGCCCVGVVGFV